MVQLRDAQVSDAEAIARVQIETWRSTYRGLMPDSVIDKFTNADRAGSWRAGLSGDRTQRHDIVAETKSGEVIGFSCGGLNRTTEFPFAGEVYAIYVLPTFQRAGVGTHLFHRSLTTLLRDGMLSALVWALEGNRRANDFYKKCGGECLGERWETFDDEKLNHFIYGWRDLSSYLRLKAESGGQ
jgi:GNAT superfamily N-acetyltransferase